MLPGMSCGSWRIDQVGPWLAAWRSKNVLIAEC